MFEYFGYEAFKQFGCQVQLKLVVLLFQKAICPIDQLNYILVYFESCSGTLLLKTTTYL